MEICNDLRSIATTHKYKWLETERPSLGDPEASMLGDKVASTARRARPPATRRRLRNPALLNEDNTSTYMYLVTDSDWYKVRLGGYKSRKIVPL